ncbi:hypothetical protein BJ912DRAFT_925118 [Pholiota molesta]|nr:hypothetical protein BJ912DRAFT_925118 [Pholiota molesta]
MYWDGPMGDALSVVHWRTWAHEEKICLSGRLCSKQVPGSHSVAQKSIRDALAGAWWMPRTLHVQNDYVSALRPVLNIAVEGFFAPGFEGERAYRALTIVPRHLNHRAAVWSNEDCLPVHAPPPRPDEMNPFWWMTVPSDPPPPYMVPSPRVASSFMSRPVSGSSSSTERQMFSVKKPKFFYSNYRRDGQGDGVPACRIHSAYLIKRQAHKAFIARKVLARTRYVETDNEDENSRDEESSSSDEGNSDRDE